jgi:hypothetical protein
MLVGARGFEPLRAVGIARRTISHLDRRHCQYDSGAATFRRSGHLNLGSIQE